MPDASHPHLQTADADGIARAAALLRAGKLVAVPTETVYGLAARADCADAVARIYRAKGRPDFNPLIVHVADLAAASRLALIDDRAHNLADTFWPGPLTMVLPRRDDAELAEATTAGLATVALRCPAHPVMHALLDACGVPLAAPSANRSGAVSPTDAAHVQASLGDAVDMILDGGRCRAGLESTIVALREDGDWQVLRPGPIETDRISAILGRGPATVTSTAIEAPGQLASHYSPGKPVRLDVQEARADEFFIGFGAIAGDCNLSSGGDLAEAASHFYEALHKAAAAPQPRIAVAPVPHEGMGEAINDRLHRAAAPLPDQSR